MTNDEMRRHKLGADNYPLTEVIAVRRVRWIENVVYAC